MENGAVKPYDDDRERGRRSGGPRSLFEHFERSLSRPFDSWGSFPEFNALWDEGPMRSLCQDVHAVAGTKVDWKETKDAHIFKADLPGLSKEDVKVTIEDGQLLRISGERSREKEDRTDTWHRVERSHGRFLRQFRLPDDANTEQVQAKVENGVLSVTVPKLQTTENPRHRNIQIE